MSLAGVFGRLWGRLEVAGMPPFFVKHYREWVQPGVLMRGSFLTDSELVSLMLEKPPIRSILNLCQENDADTLRVASFFPIPASRPRVEHIPVIDNYALTRQQIDFILGWIADKQNQPVYVHCEAGKGRTGVAVACFRIAQGWTVAGAIAEAVEHGMILPEQQRCVLAWADRR